MIPLSKRHKSLVSVVTMELVKAMKKLDLSVWVEVVVKVGFSQGGYLLSSLAFWANVTPDYKSVIKIEDKNKLILGVDVSKMRITPIKNFEDVLKTKVANTWSDNIVCLDTYFTDFEIQQLRNHNLEFKDTELFFKYKQAYIQVCTDGYAVGTLKDNFFKKVKNRNFLPIAYMDFDDSTIYYTKSLFAVNYGKKDWGKVSFDTFLMASEFPFLKVSMDFLSIKLFHKNLYVE